MRPALAGCALLLVASCNTDDSNAPPSGPSAATAPGSAYNAVSAYNIVQVGTGAINVDGNLTEWANIPAVPTFADDPVRGAAANTAKVKLAWDGTFLYLAYNITDTELLAVETARDAAHLYQDDEVELYIDPQGDGAAASRMTTTDYHLLGSVRNVVGDNRGNISGGQDASYNANSLIARALVSGTLNAAGTDQGYTLEMKVSWADLGVAPSVGKFMRIDLAVGDRDTPVADQYFDWANLGNNFNQPSGWKDVQLAGPVTVGIPFGLWGLNFPLENSVPWTGIVRQSKNHFEVLRILDSARVHHVGVWLGMTGGYSGYRTNGSFDLAKWEDSLDAGHGGGVVGSGPSLYYNQYLPYIQDKTFLGIVLLDDLSSPNFVPTVSFSEVEAMAAYSKMRFPALPTAVRERATILESRAPLKSCNPSCAGGANHSPYANLDAAWAQFRYPDRGTATQYRDDNIAAAQREQLGLLLGINISFGDRSVNTTTGNPVTATQLLDWGTEFLRPVASDYVCGFFMFDSTYVHNSTIYTSAARTNMNTLASKARAHVAAPCKRR
jgi:hypothetical protein